MSTHPELFPTSTTLKRCVIRAFKKRNPNHVSKEDMRQVLETIPEGIVSLCYSIRNSLQYGKHFFLTIDGDQLEPLILKNFICFRIHCLKEDEELFSKEMATSLRTYAQRPEAEQTALVRARLVIIDNRVALLSLHEKPTTLTQVKPTRKRANVMTLRSVKKEHK